MSFAPGIPLLTTNVSTGANQIADNFTDLNNTFGIDHFKFDAASNKGLHQKITLPVPLVVSPAPDPVVSGNQGELYSKEISAVAQLFFANSSGAIQLSGFSFSAIPSGYITLQGGIIIKWGSGSGSLSGASNVFPTAFPNACWVVNFTPHVAGERQIGVIIDDKTKFHAYTSSSAPIYYIAIGN